VVDLNRLREFAGSGATMAQTARELGVTRARIHQLAVRHSIAFRRMWTFAPDAKKAFEAQKTDPPPRNPTGGVEVKFGQAIGGKTAALLACADLLARGWQVYLPVSSNRGHDIVASRGNCILTFEVNLAYRSETGNLSFKRKREQKSTHCALVVKGEPVIYRPALPPDDDGNRC
jgi:hypothetical protein